MCALKDRKDGLVGGGSLFLSFTTSDNEAQDHVCGWCLERGKGTLVRVGHVFILSSHDECQKTVGGYVPGTCSCRDPLHPGDDPNCPVHGGAKC